MLRDENDSHPIPIKIVRLPRDFQVAGKQCTADKKRQYEILTAALELINPFINSNNGISLGEWQNTEDRQSLAPILKVSVSPDGKPEAIDKKTPGEIIITFNNNLLQVHLTHSRGTKSITLGYDQFKQCVGWKNGQNGITAFQDALLEYYKKLGEPKPRIPKGKARDFPPPDPSCK